MTLPATRSACQRRANALKCRPLAHQETRVSYALSTALLALGLFLSILGSLEVGRRIGLTMRRRFPDVEIKGSSAAEGAVFGLLGLLIAFTFSGAAGRFEDRRHLITEEANAIGTAWLRVDLLPAASASAVRASSATASF